MQKIYCTEIMNRSKDSNALYIKFINTSNFSNLVNLTIYDYTNPTPKVSYNKSLYLTPKSAKAMTLPLSISDYDDCVNIESYKICYTKLPPCIKLSYKELSIE